MTFPTGAQPLIIVTPESFYQFSLNRHEEQVALWTSAIPDDAYLVVGTQATDGRKMYQVAALAQAGLIKKYYVKHHCVPFTEKIPKFWRRMTPLRNFFLHNADEFSKGKSPLGAGVFDVGAGVRLIPQVCSEFFFKLFSPQVWHVCREQQGRRHALLLLVNDSWFVGYFQRIIKALTALKAAYLGIPVIYVGHTECRWYGGAGGV
jgi:apolipoprotein N-acyltransferase